MKTTVNVDLGVRSYPIHIAPGQMEDLGQLCQGMDLGGTALVVTDSNLDPIYGERCESSLAAAGIQVRRTAVPAGESSKNLEQLGRLYDEAIAGGLDRKSFVVALGGGVVGDLGGFFAATWLRGITFVQVPTSIVAMVDSAVGGKTGINLPQGKNLVGSFWQPAAVVADLDVVKTLPEREFVSGLAEVIKYGVIWDAEMFSMLESEREKVLARDPVLLRDIVARSCEIKAEVVRRDEREGGLRMILNYGHTVGHAIEKVADYGTYLHGEAISVGMAYASRLSEAEAGLSAADAERIEQLLSDYGLPVRASECAWPALREAISLDKKSVARMPRFVLADRIGGVRFGCEVSEDVLEGQWASMT